MTNFSISYAQNLTQVNNSKDPEIEIMIINNDTLFTMNRKFAEMVIIQSDSLLITTKKLDECLEVVDSSINIISKYKEAFNQSNEIREVMRLEIEKKDKIIKSYVKIEETQNKLLDNLNNEFRKLKTRNTILTSITIGGVTVGFTSIILLLLK